MKNILIRTTSFQCCQPKICIPIMPANKEDLLKSLQMLENYPYDLIEWRLDHYHGSLEYDDLKDSVKMIRSYLKEKPLLVTMRSVKEGGQRQFSLQEYLTINKRIMDTSEVDLVDLEFSLDRNSLKELVEYARSRSIFVLMSSHDFQKTPTKNEIIQRLCDMQKNGADICKMAVMPSSMSDVLTLLEASLEMKEKFVDYPFVLISMGREGMISRFTGKLFGSCMTFGSASSISAPGQIDSNDLKLFLDLFQRSTLKE